MTSGSTEVVKSDAEKKLRKAYGAATTRLREAHRDEFNRYQTEEAKKLGVEWKPRPSKSEQAAAQLEALLESNPELIDKFAERLAQKGTASG